MRGRHKHPFFLHVIRRASAISNDDSSPPSPSRSARRIFRRQRSPADILLVATPFDPRGGPFGVRHPNPALVRVFIPPAIVVGDFSKGLIGVKIPADFFVIDPISPRVRFPILGQPSGLPNLANGRNLHKLALRRDTLSKDVYGHRDIGLRYLSKCCRQKWRRGTDH